jgi:hypothetical protein
MTERDRFEAYIAKRDAPFHCADTLMRSALNGEHYRNLQLQHDWNVWQARARDEDPEQVARDDMLLWLFQQNVEVRDRVGNILAMWYEGTDPLLVRATIQAARLR